jgi:DNA-binding NtrC family response regulator
VGSNDPVRVDVRIIAASNRDLETAYRGGTFRKDLYFRLNVVTVHLPPLRERKSDIPALVRCFLDRYAPEHDVRITPSAMTCLLQYDWPGNVRDLENCVERAVALRNDDTIDVSDLPPGLRGAQPFVPSLGAEPAFHTTDLEEIERVTIQRVFEQVNGDKALAGRLLGISRATLYRKLKRYNIDLKPQSSRAAAGVVASAD